MLRIVQIFLLSFIVVLFGLSSTSCRSQVCASPFVCQGYGCVDLICLQSCEDNQDCDLLPREGKDGAKIPSGYVCKNQACVCDPAQPKAYCHRECHSAKDCNQRIDPKTKQTLTTKRGFRCQDPATEDIPDGAKPGQCVCAAEESCQS